MDLSRERNFAGKHRRRTRAALVCAAISGSIMLSAFPAGATAQSAFDQSRSISPFHRLSDGNGRTIPCVCSVAGRLVPLGSVACLNLPDGRQLARCELATNVTSWVATGVECPVSRHQSPIPNPRT